MISLKARQERFCRRFVELANAAGAARAAGYSAKGANVAGHRLLRHPRIARRIAEIEAETARLHSRGPEVLIGKLETVYRRAIVDHQLHTAARAVELQARIQGTIPTCVDTDGVDGPCSPASKCHMVVVLNATTERSRPRCKLPQWAWI